MSPRFSVVTPVYDPPVDVLRATIRSVTEQTFTDWQLVLVDDLSPTSAVLETLDEAAAADPRITVVRRATNGGIVAASNDALAAATGEFVALLDHDDELHPDALRLVDEALRARPEADYAYTDEDKIDEHDRRTGSTTGACSPRRRQPEARPPSPTPTRRAPAPSRLTASASACPPPSSATSSSAASTTC